MYTDESDHYAVQLTRP